jgi:hypothetical protein
LAGFPQLDGLGSAAHPCSQSKIDAVLAGRLDHDGCVRHV